MARPRAIYASVPVDGQVIPKWDNVSGEIPVEYNKPFQYWPDFDWAGNTIDDNNPTEYSLEHPKYLWSHPVVQNPVYGEDHIFIRQWLVGQRGGAFDHQTIPADNLVFIITLAADDQYAFAFQVGGLDTGAVQKPLGSNTNMPADFSWRNAKAYFYHIDLTQVNPGTLINFVTEVTNLPQIPHGNADSNPAMFTWIMYIYNYS